MFFKGSRYTKVEDATLTDALGRETKYKKVRFTPIVRSQAGHRVDDGERLDHIAHRYYRDPERFWRICDANLTMWPDDLVTEPGKVIGIPPAEG